MKLVINGILGHMGREVAGLAAEGFRGAELIGGADVQSGEAFGVPVVNDIRLAPKTTDCVVDFSHHSCTGALLDYAVSNRIPLVLATTGQTDAERAAIAAAAKQIPVFFAANYSLGVALLIELAKKAAAVMPEAEIEIIERHHDRKLDAPSGTALAIAEAIREVRPEAYPVTGRSGHGKRTKEEIGIHAVRMGNLVGEHEVIIGTATQSLTLKHEAYSRALFAEGALAAAEFLCRQGPGLYDMKSILTL